MPSTDEPYEVCESYDWFATDAELNDPARGDEPTEETLA